MKLFCSIQHSLIITSLKCHIQLYHLISYLSYLCQRSNFHLVCFLGETAGMCVVNCSSVSLLSYWIWNLCLFMTPCCIVGVPNKHMSSSEATSVLWGSPSKNARSCGHYYYFILLPVVMFELYMSNIGLFQWLYCPLLMNYLPLLM